MYVRSYQNPPGRCKPSQPQCRAQTLGPNFCGRTTRIAPLRPSRPFFVHRQPIPAPSRPISVKRAGAPRRPTRQPELGSTPVTKRRSLRASIESSRKETADGRRAPFRPTDPPATDPEQRADELAALPATGVRRLLGLRADAAPSLFLPPATNLSEATQNALMAARERDFMCPVGLVR